MELNQKGNSKRSSSSTNPTPLDTFTFMRPGSSLINIVICEAIEINSFTTFKALQKRPTEVWEMGYLSFMIYQSDKEF